jgi:hypothetical protein
MKRTRCSNRSLTQTDKELSVRLRRNVETKNKILHILKCNNKQNNLFQTYI